MKRTLKRESKESEIAKGEAMSRDFIDCRIMVEFVGSVYSSLGSVLSCSTYPASLLALRQSFFSVSTYLVISQFEWYLAAAWVTLSVFSLFLY